LDIDSYDRYVRAEWALAAADPSRQAAAREATDGVSVSRVLDIGCGAGQELRPFVSDPGCFGVGIDLSREVGVAGRDLFAREQPASRVAFVRAGAEQLPFAPSCFDAVICRLALPYMNNRQALSEMARVLRPNGALLLKFHHARYYGIKFRDGIMARDFKSSIHACRVLLAGCAYHITGTQPRNRLTGRETFQTLWLLRRELRRLGLNVRRILPDSVAAAPSLLIRR
jgi:ubiquinone/menaquinone biosynthesis C-methylase UbiE